VQMQEQYMYMYDSASQLTPHGDEVAGGVRRHTFHHLIVSGLATVPFTAA
jgi:hypothetical protein